MKYTIQLIRYETGVTAPPKVLSSVSAGKVPAAEVRRALRKRIGHYMDNSTDRMSPDLSANAIRALDETGAEVDRWTVSDEQGMRIVEDR